MATCPIGRSGLAQDFISTRAVPIRRRRKPFSAGRKPEGFGVESISFTSDKPKTGALPRLLVGACGRHPDRSILPRVVECGPRSVGTGAAAPPASTQLATTCERNRRAFEEPRPAERERRLLPRPRPEQEAGHRRGGPLPEHGIRKLTPPRARRRTQHRADCAAGVHRGVGRTRRRGGPGPPRRGILMQRSFVGPATERVVRRRTRPPLAIAQCAPEPTTLWPSKNFNRP
jgi:hypothetical protein